MTEKIVNQLLSISEKSFDHWQNEYSDVILALEQAISEENAFNAGKKVLVSDLKLLNKKIKSWLKQLPIVGFKSGNYDLNVLKKN